MTGYQALRGQKVSGTVKRAALYAVLLLGMVSVLIPFLWMVSTSLKELNQVYLYPIQWIPNPVKWENYARVLSRNFHLFFLNSFKVTGLVLVFQLLTSSLAGYSLSHLRYPGRNTLFLFYVATIMIPGQALLVPQFVLLRFFHLTNTHAALIVLGAFSPFAVFLLRQSFMSIPHETVEAARIDGSGEFRTYCRIILPMSIPSLAAIAIFIVMGTWNDLLGPTVFLFTKELFTLPRGLISLSTDRIFEQETNVLMAGTVLSILPLTVLFLFMQKYFISGISAGALKG